MDEHAALSLKGVSVDYGAVRAVDEVGLVLRHGELTGLIGPNGAGKTSLIKAIAGVSAAQGEIRLGRLALSALPSHERVQAGLAWTHQIVRPFRHLSLLDNVVLGAGRRRSAYPWRSLLAFDVAGLRQEALRCLARVGLANLADAQAGSQPLGVLKRLEIARALATGARCLMLDEPLAGLSDIEARQASEVIAGLAQEGIALLLVEHNVAEVKRICPRLVVMSNGCKLADGPAEQVLRDEAVQQAYFGGGLAADA